MTSLDETEVKILNYKTFDLVHKKKHVNWAMVDEIISELKSCLLTDILKLVVQYTKFWSCLFNFLS